MLFWVSICHCWYPRFFLFRSHSVLVTHETEFSQLYWKDSMPLFLLYWYSNNTESSTTKLCPLIWEIPNYAFAIAIAIAILLAMQSPMIQTNPRKTRKYTIKCSSNRDFLYILLISQLRRLGCFISRCPPLFYYKIPNPKKRTSRNECNVVLPIFKSEWLYHVGETVERIHRLDVVRI